MLRPEMVIVTVAQAMLRPDLVIVTVAQAMLHPDMVMVAVAQAMLRPDLVIVTVAQAMLRPKRGVRADEAAPGSGLGLAIVRDLTEVYGGTITLEGSPLGGLRARLRLPKA